ncbi:SDR family oxidoreductase [Thauera linaloolentis]|uniref:Quinone oxidoreductase 2 n=1 Tax=Thauera linaloolentis (strain DSM 12138 / JCM 21573 / CCUG 41526 / CIP 105981 / IAM 15112 / NBRC 102519 / 47Lol) TaxID=1123367 RepID=N6Z1Y0_THAL4|nr:SDR family oxidoreductase [Thauera linaloolentis]ENO88622.1 quinone oxidoreductase 2 [Thauera linaloolentis 47Lol = DSM 12138]MCM8565667.1 SDR family oxidoreductase [Thauera linaloolentis]
MTIAVTGATGQLGRIVVQKLLGKTSAHDIVALARDPAKAANLGVAARAADYTNPQSLAAALAGVDKLLLISSSEIGQRATQHRNVIAAARQAGVSLLVYTSLLHADRSTLDLADEHRATEADLKASGLPHVILRNGWYTENYTGSIGGALVGGAFLGSAGDGRIASAARADYAEAAVAVLTSAAHEGKTYELAGDHAYTLTDLAAEISRQTGKDTPYKDLPVAEYAAVLAGVGIPEGFAKAIAGWDAEVAKGVLFDDGRQLSQLIGRQTTPLADTVAAALKALV